MQLKKNVSPAASFRPQLDPSRLQNPAPPLTIMSISWDKWSYIVSAAILDFWLSVASGNVTDSTIEKFDPQNMGLAIRISFL